jgi:glycine reductase
MGQIDLSGRRVIAIGERDGVQAEAIAACARAAGASILMQQTHCFV